MKFMNKLKKFTELRSWFGLMLAGLFIAAVCAAVFFLGSRKNYEPVNAVVADIDYEGEDNAVSAVYVDYTVGGKEYKHVALGSFSSDVEIGQSLECKYDPENPADIRSAGGMGMALIIGLIGLLAFVFGLVKLIATLKRSADSYEQFDRAAAVEADPAVVEAIRNSTEAAQDYTWHFTGKLNQSYVMEDAFGAEVYRADCEKLQLIKDTAYDFSDLRTGETFRKMVSHTLTLSEGLPGGFNLQVPISSVFKLDGVKCWDYLAQLGYGFDFSLRGLTACYDVKHYGVPVAHLEEAGSEILKKKYKGNVLGRIPTKGLYRISCRPSDVPAVFMIAFVLNRISEFGND